MNNQKIIPFGKYKNMPIDVLQEDKAYAEWLLTQSWFKEKYSDINTLIINNFNIKTDDTPEHNMMQVKFLKEGYRLKLAFLILGSQLFKFNNKYFKEYLQKILSSLDLTTDESKKVIIKEIKQCNNRPLLYPNKPVFEDNGLDVSYTVTYGYDTSSGIGTHAPKELRDFVNKIWDANSTISLKIELKPTVSDDFPSILRQLKNSKANVLILKEYMGRGANFEEFKDFFKLENIHVIFEEDIEMVELPEYDKTLEFNLDEIQLLISCTKKM